MQNLGLIVTASGGHSLVLLWKPQQHRLTFYLIIWTKHDCIMCDMKVKDCMICDMNVLDININMNKVNRNVLIFLYELKNIYIYMVYKIANMVIKKIKNYKNIIMKVNRCTNINFKIEINTLCRSGTSL